jgi:predicted RNA-binding protein associated with RNAse of E/G family
MDHLLDIVVSPDLSSWHWKDEDEFSEALEHGVYSLREAKAIREEGEHVVNTLQDDNSLFFRDWEKWRPPSDWQIPAMPRNWDDLSFYDKQS